MTGPGSTLKAILSAMPVDLSSGQCSCAAMAAKMDLLGADWCLSPTGMREIVDSMRENAGLAGVPFSEIAARALVYVAVRLSGSRDSTPSAPAP